MHKLSKQEARLMRRELINYYLQNFAPFQRTNVFMLRDMKFLVRNGEAYRYGKELNVYKYFKG